MFGRGVISIIHGWALERAGYQVEFYVRPGRAAQLGTTVNLELLDMSGLLRGRRVTETWSLRVSEDLPAELITT